MNIWIIKCRPIQKNRNAATRCVLRAYNAAECDYGQTPLQTSLGEITDPLAILKGAASQRGGEGTSGERKERRGAQRRMRGGKLEQGRRLAKSKTGTESPPVQTCPCFVFAHKFHTVYNARSYNTFDRTATLSDATLLMTLKPLFSQVFAVGCS